MSCWTVGIDPGATGAIALLDSYGELVEVHDMPYAGGAVLVASLADVINAFSDMAGAGPRYGDGIVHAWVEQVHSHPGQGVASTFKFGQSYGAILGVLGALAVPIDHVSPMKWKRAMHVTKDKGTSRRLAAERWPRHADKFKRVKDDGRAEAALIALYGYQQVNR